MEHYKGYYAAKFARLEKERPVDWLIIPEQGTYRLVFIGGTT